MRCQTRTVAVALAAVVTIGALAAPSMAASRTTYISGWREANRSSTWGDNATSDPTKVTMQNCWVKNTSGTPITGTFSNAVFTLWQQRGAWPDRTRGDKAFYCTYSAINTWVSDEADTYYLELRSIWKQNGVRCYCYFYSNPVTISW